MIKCSLITAVYNSHNTLPKFLLALSIQTERDFELIISDDGSVGNYDAIISEHQKYFKHKIKYVVHKRDGIQKTKTLNRGIVAAESDYLLFIDPDCLASPAWVEVHLRERESGAYLFGRRTDYREAMTRHITDDFIVSGKFSKLNIFNLYHYLSGHYKHFKQMLIVRNSLLRRLLNRKKSTYLFGCNFSCWKSDIFRVNGWDNDFRGLGAEDVELDLRFKNIGLRPKPVRHLTNVFHLYHKSRKNDEWGDYLKDHLHKDYVWVENGIDTLIEEETNLSL